ncbi:hypothetical protein ZTR_06558 [Talaromyces verruculosus]|nr:hypothetical protein ZTR_06558 [Talaromyces verruculosus]
MANNSLSILRSRYASSLKEFISSPRTFEILDRVPTESHERRPAQNARSLFILDSSFNPPTAAHLEIASTALEESPHSSRLLLLLATQNADKPSKPASFEDRLVMMTLFAQELRTHLQSSLPSIPAADLPQVDIGVTKKPYFVDKAAAIEQSGEYPDDLEQVHLTGYDTLIRIFNPKYYPPTHTLQPLEPFLSRHRLRVTTRPDDEWGNLQEQEEYLRHLAQGGREQEGGKREWAERIQLIPGRKIDEVPVSSTRARNAARSKDTLLHSLVPATVSSYIMAQELYQSNDI